MLCFLPIVIFGGIMSTQFLYQITLFRPLNRIIRSQAAYRKFYLQIFLETWFHLLFLHSEN